MSVCLARVDALSGDGRIMHPLILTIERALCNPYDKVLLKLTLLLVRRFDCHKAVGKQDK